MNRDKVIGGLLLVVSAVIIVVYGWLVFTTIWWEFVLKITGFLAIAALFGILGWIGYTLATTPPPKPIEEIEKELEEELKKIEKEIKEEKPPEAGKEAPKPSEAKPSGVVKEA